MADYPGTGVDLRPVLRAVGDLSHELGRELSVVSDHVEGVRRTVGVVDEKVSDVNSNVKIVYSELGKLARDFNEYVVKAEMQHQVELATTKLGNAEARLKAEFGHYDAVRRSARGILQATDAGIVKKDTLTNVSEEMMITCAGYWLAPCLVALAAWINDDVDIAEKAIKEAIKRDDDKTSLLFGLICRRADRSEAAIKWISRYLSRQNPESLKREAIIVLDAYSAGLFYSESDDTLSNQIAEWLEHIVEKPGFLEDETAKWKTALEGRKRPFKGSDYTYLKDFSKTWGSLASIMEGACLHQEILDYFEGILATPSSMGAVKAQLDGIMNDLVTGCDDEELPLMKEIKENKLIIAYEGDLSRAMQAVEDERIVFEERTSFTETLTKAVMYPDDVKASPSTQKLALSLSREWISDAYSQVIAENRLNIPTEIEINIDTFNDKTKDGTDEERLVKAFNDHIDLEKREALEAVKLKPLDIYLGIGGAAAAVIELIMAAMGVAMGGNMLLGIFIVIVGGAMIFRYRGKQKAMQEKCAAIEKQFEEKRAKGVAILRAVIAEIVDFKIDFDLADAVGEDVIDLLDQLDPDECVSAISGAGRTAMLSA